MQLIFFTNFYVQYKKWIKLVLGLFSVSIIAGAVLAFYYPDLMQHIFDAFAERFGDSPALDTNLAKEIFIQNLTASLIAWLGGLILGIAPFLMVALNGLILGYVVCFVAMSSERVWEGIVFLLLGLLPHGILEIPAFLTAAVLGLSLGLNWLSSESSGQRLEVLKVSFIGSIKYFSLVVVFLAAAALIEVFVSGKLVGNF
jgi:stage II sporulation protein M